MLTAAQRAAVRNAADAGGARWFGLVPLRWSWGVGAVAAAAIVAAVLPLLPESSRPGVVSAALLAPGLPATELRPTAPQVAGSTTQTPPPEATPSSTGSP